MDLFKKMQVPEGVNSENIYVGSENNKKFTIIFEGKNNKNPPTAELKCY